MDVVTQPLAGLLVTGPLIGLADLLGLMIYQSTRRDKLQSGPRTRAY